MRTLYLDPFAGIAGDMFLGAMIDLGADRQAIQEGISSLGIPDLRVEAPQTVKGGISGVDVHVTCGGHEDHHHDGKSAGGRECEHRHEGDSEHGHEHDHAHDHHDHSHDHEGDHHHDHGGVEPARAGEAPSRCTSPEHGHEHGHGHGHEHGHVHRGLNEIRRMISDASLPSRVKDRSIRAFELLAQAEGAVHGKLPEEVHFHEVGAWDSIADVVGSFLAVELLNVDKIVSAPVNLGSGTVCCAHGRMPVPAPATAKLVQGLPVYSAGIPCERTTPTGALILRVLVDSYGPLPAGKIVAEGIGHGDAEPGDPNYLRAVLIEEDAGNSAHELYTTGQVAVLETNLDDLNPQDWPPVVEKLFAAGALDVFLTQLLMKKGRPGIRLTCVARPSDRQRLGEIILQEINTLGVRWRLENRMTLRRGCETFQSSLGPVGVKRAYWGDELLRWSFEFEDVKRLAAEKGLSTGEVRRRLALEFIPGQNE